MPRHACLGATSACAFSPSPPTHHASPPSPSPCLLLVHVPTPFATHSHTAKPHHHATPHTHAWWLVHFGAWCGVCVCPRCWLWPRLARHSHVHPLLVPHTTPLLLLLLLLVDVVVAAWVLWRVWPLGPLTGCAGAVHSRITHTHTRGDGHVVVVAVCVVWLPPPLCAFPTNHHHCVRCPALPAVCVSVSGGTTHTRPLWCHPRCCVCVSERRGHHTHHPRCRPMCPLSPLTRHATPATLSQMPRLTSLTHMACFVWLLPSTHTHTHWLADCPHALHTPPPLGVRVLIHLLSSATHTHSHTGRTGVAHAWVVAGVVTTTTPLVPHHHTHTAGLVVWAMVVLGGARVPCVCLPRHHHTRLPSHHHHQRSCATTALTHTHTRDLVHAPLPHTRHMHHHTHQGVLCVDHTMPHPPPPTPSPHSHTHTTWHTHTRHQPHCHNGACHRSPRRPLTHN